jgi:predicted 3-demethylubiquinone-9 3-methyltransferase (glyoxalase superfamily)
MPRIISHLWFDREAVEAAEFYVATFPESRIEDVSVVRDTPSGDTDVVSFEVYGHPFQAINAGPLFRFNPSVSFAVACDTAEEVDHLWGRLSDGGNVVMPLDAYPFSPRYGWVEDRYGLSWQISHAADQPVTQRVTPTLMFVGDVCGQAEEAIGHYTSVFPDAKVDGVFRYGPDDAPNEEGTVQYASFVLDGQQFAAMDSSLDHGFGFNEAISFLISCGDQAEIDHYWQALSTVPEAEQCGWLKDRHGLSWQVVPSAMDRMLREGTDEQRARDHARREKRERRAREIEPAARPDRAGKPKRAKGRGGGQANRGPDRVLPLAARVSRCGGQGSGTCRGHLARDRRSLDPSGTDRTAETADAGTVGRQRDAGHRCLHAVGERGPSGPGE